MGADCRPRLPAKRASGSGAGTPAAPTRSPPTIRAGCRDPHRRRGWDRFGPGTWRPGGQRTYAYQVASDKFRARGSPSRSPAATAERTYRARDRRDRGRGTNWDGRRLGGGRAATRTVRAVRRLLGPPPGPVIRPARPCQNTTGRCPDLRRAGERDANAEPARYSSDNLEGARPARPTPTQWQAQKRGDGLGANRPGARDGRAGLQAIPGGPRDLMTLQLRVRTPKRRTGAGFTGAITARFGRGFSRFSPDAGSTPRPATILGAARNRDVREPWTRHRSWNPGGHLLPPTSGHKPRERGWRAPGVRQHRGSGRRHYRIRFGASGALRGMFRTASNANNKGDGRRGSGLNFGRPPLPVSRAAPAGQPRLAPRMLGATRRFRGRGDAQRAQQQRHGEPGRAGGLTANQWQRRRRSRLFVSIGRARTRTAYSCWRGRTLGPPLRLRVFAAQKTSDARPAARGVGRRLPTRRRKTPLIRGRRGLRPRLRTNRRILEELPRGSWAAWRRMA